jgi:hypothetical protein
MVAIDAVVADRTGQDDWVRPAHRLFGHHTLAEINMPHCRAQPDWLVAPDVGDGGSVAGLPLVVRTLKREVRAYGGCLGMHRR